MVSDVAIGEVDLRNRALFLVTVPGLMFSSSWPSVGTGELDPRSKALFLVKGPGLMFTYGSSMVVGLAGDDIDAASVTCIALIFFFLTLFGFGGAGGGAPSSYTSSLHVFYRCPKPLHLLHLRFFLVDPPSSTPTILLVLGRPGALFRMGGHSLKPMSTFSH